MSAAAPTQTRPPSRQGGGRDALTVLALLLCGPLGIILVLTSRWKLRTKIAVVAIYLLATGAVPQIRWLVPWAVLVTAAVVAWEARSPIGAGIVTLLAGLLILTVIIGAWFPVSHDGFRKSEIPFAAIDCSDYYQTTRLPAHLASAHVNAGLCEDGKRAWRAWGPDCYADTLMIGQSVRRCDTTTLKDGSIEVRSDYSLEPLAAPFLGRRFRVRFTLHPDGTVSGL